MSDIISIINSKIESNRIILYKSLEGYYRTSNRTSFTSNQNPKGVIKGKLSDNSKKKIKNIVISWLSTVQFYLLSNGYSLSETGKHIKFITLTLSDTQHHGDKEIKALMLNRFLTRIKRNYGMQNYLWIAETQRNGNLHFHIITDINIHHKALRDSWNKIQRDNGYLNTYYEKNKHYNANSTDIHTLKKINNLAAYLSKEMTKGQGNRPISGKLWGCSENLLKLKSFESLLNSGTVSFIDRIRELKETRILRDEWFTVIFFDSIKYFEELDFNELPEIYDYYHEQMNILFYN